MISETKAISVCVLRLFSKAKVEIFRQKESIASFY